MTVRQLIDMAKYGELSKVARKTDDKAIVSYINLGTIELSKRFDLYTDEGVIALDNNKTLYKLSDYGMSNCMSIVAAYGEVPERSSELLNQIPINEEENPCSIMTVNYNTVQVPLAVTDSYISIIYKAYPEYIVVDDDDIYLDTEVPVPDFLVEALLHYIGYRAIGSIDSNVQAENNTHYMRFEASCKNVTRLGLVAQDSFDMSSRVYDGGFV